MPPLTNEQLQTLEALLVATEQALERCGKSLLTSDEASETLCHLWEQALALLPKGSDTWRTLDRIEKSDTAWWTVTTSGYVHPHDCRSFEILRQALRTILESSEPEFLRRQKKPKDQRFFGPGEAYEAKKAVYDVMRTAKISLAIIDEYLDDTVFDYLASLDKNVGLKLLTGDRKPMFKKLLDAFVIQRGEVQAKICTDCHDRFILIDDGEIFHMGASINGIGTKGFMLNKITDANERKKLTEQFHAWWSSGMPI